MINVEKYKKMGFGDWQIEELKLAIKNGIDEVDIEKYMENIDFDSYQLQQIRLGLQDKLDVSLYATKDIPHGEMKKIRLKQLEDKLKDQQEKTRTAKETIKQERIVIGRSRLENVKAFLTIVLIVILLAAIGGILYLFKDGIIRSFQVLELELPSETVEIAYGDSFNPSDYIIKVSDGDDIVKIFPSFKTDTLGEYELEYAITNNYKSVKKILNIKVVDNVKPVIELNEKEITLTRDIDKFNGEDYIKSISDNYDLNLKAQISELDWSKDKQDIVYSVIDSSGNNNTVSLTVNIKDKPKVEIQEKPVISHNSQSNNETVTETPYEPPQSTQNTTTEQKPPKQEEKPKPASNTYINATSITVKKGTSIGDVQAKIIGGISSSAGYWVDFSEVNTSAPGSYTVYIHGDDGAEGSCTVNVTD